MERNSRPELWRTKDKACHRGPQSLSAGRPALSPVRVFGALGAGILVVAFGVFSWSPSWRPLLISEDQFLENVEATLFLASFGLGVAALIRQRDPGPHRVQDGLIAVLGLLLFLEEISYGERIFSLTMPRLYGVKIDSAHDLLFVAYKLLLRGSWLATLTALLVCLAAGTTLAVALRRRRPLPAALRAEPPRFVALCLILVVFAQILDLEIVRAGALTLLEELFETLAALALVFAGAVAAGDESPLHEGATECIGGRSPRRSSASEAVRGKGSTLRPSAAGNVPENVLLPAPAESTARAAPAPPEAKIPRSRT